jgi:hypothetical protein
MKKFNVTVMKKYEFWEHADVEVEADNADAAADAALALAGEDETSFGPWQEAHAECTNIGIASAEDTETGEVFEFDEVDEDEPVAQAAE